MKSSLLFLSIAFVSMYGATLSGQSKVTFGRSYRIFGSNENIVNEQKFYLKKDDELLGLKQKDNCIYLQRFDAQQLSMSKIHIYQDFPKNFEIEKVEEYCGRYFMFYSARDKNIGKEVLYAREINFDDCVFAEKGKRIAEIEGRIPREPGKNKFHFETSYDLSRLMIKYKLPSETEAKKRYEVNGFCIFDNNLVPLAKQKLRMPFPENKMNNIDYSIDTEGNVYILSHVFNDDWGYNKYPDRPRDYHVELCTIKFNSRDASIAPIMLGDTSEGCWNIRKISLFGSPGKHVYCGGFYNKDNDVGPVSGVFIFKIDKDGKPYDVLSYDITEELKRLDAMHADEDTEENSAENIAQLKGLNLSDLFIQQDGGLLLIGEQHYKMMHPYFNKFTKEVDYVPSYHYNNMVLIRTDSTNKISWIKKLAKNQTTLIEKGVMSYKYLQGGKFHYLMYLDHEKNSKLDLDDYPTNYTDGLPGSLNAYRINDEDGAVQKIPLLPTLNTLGTKALTIFPSRIIPLSATEFVTEITRNKKEDMLLRIEIPE